MSTNVSLESGSSSQQQPTGLTKDDTSYATVVLSLKSQPRDQEKNDNNKENIKKDVNHIDASSKQIDVLAAAQSNQQQPQPSTTSSSDDVDQNNFDDDDLFTPVVSHNRKERRNGRKDKPKNRQLSGSSRPRPRVVKSENRERRDNNKKDGRDRAEAGKDVATKIENQTENATCKSGNEEETDSEPVKFVEAPIPKVNAWKELSRGINKKLV
ncbi:hypothetical protein Bhyg_10300 [Pseudolycoriella hygida]|uniref:Uncharacterized protein n=1 Tax=Pseudolycoriella hygida TaxID=35572 RepID=A0A9Q0MUY5_9DIPT|nr:hypothetical protein Bhyg_10300 [Pseudolycoriella hygida]